MSTNNECEQSLNTDSVCIMKKDKNKKIALILLLTPFIGLVVIATMTMVFNMIDIQSFRIFVIFCVLCPILFGTSLVYALRSLRRGKSKVGYVLAGTSGLFDCINHRLGDGYNLQSEGHLARFARNDCYR